MVRELADALQQRGRLVHMHKQVFPDETPDQIWISDVAGRGWIIVTRDRRLQHRHIEWMAFLRAKARVLWFKGDNASNVEITEGFLSALSKIDALVAQLQPPYIIKVTGSGYVQQIYPAEEA
jgi:predicted nuclease of predicted toxin-antitoxin system